jgi:hypothetical protein
MQMCIITERVEKLGFHRRCKQTMSFIKLIKEISYEFLIDSSRQELHLIVDRESNNAKMVSVFRISCPNMDLKGCCDAISNKLRRILAIHCPKSLIRPAMQ